MKKQHFFLKPKKCLFISSWMCDKLGDFEKIPTCFSAQNDSIKIFASIFWSVSAENLIISTGKKCFDHFWPNNFFGSWATQAVCRPLRRV